MPIEVKSFASQADEAKDMPNARMEAVNVLGQRVMKLTLSARLEMVYRHQTDCRHAKLSSHAHRNHSGRNYSLRL